MNFYIPVSIWSSYTSYTGRTVRNSWSQVMGWQVCPIQAQSTSSHHPCSDEFLQRLLLTDYILGVTLSLGQYCWPSHNMGNMRLHESVTLTSHHVVVPVISVSRYHTGAKIYTYLFSYHLAGYVKSSPLGHSQCWQATPLQKLWGWTCSSWFPEMSLLRFQTHDSFLHLHSYRTIEHQWSHESVQLGPNITLLPLIKLLDFISGATQMLQRFYSIFLKCQWQKLVHVSGGQHSDWTGLYGVLCSPQVYLPSRYFNVFYLQILEYLNIIISSSRIYTKVQITI